MSPTVGLALIARNEEENLPRLLASIEGAFDQVVLVDTGSTDKTVEIFCDWVRAEKERNPAFAEWVEHFDWCDDFSAPRRYADAMLHTDWKVWADCDDTIQGAGRLRELAAQAPPELSAFIAGYVYARDANGNTICHLKRERLVRAGKAEWHGRVHEAQLIDGAVSEIPGELVQWIHHKPPADGPSNRNLRILRSWVKEEPENPRVLGYLGTEELARGRAKQSITWFRRYLKLKTGWDEERAQIHRKLSIALMSLERHDAAIEIAFEALRLLPSWPDSYLTLAEAHYRKDEHEKAAEWAQEVLRRGNPNTLLIINPQDYVVSPKILLAGSKAALGDIEQAIELAEEVLTLCPGHPLLVEPYRNWITQRKTTKTAQHFLEAAQTLCAHDEQLKALRVLEAVPHYAIDQPQIVQMRSQLRERLYPLFDPVGYADHYATGGSKPEDFIDDETVIPLGNALPRCGFLLDGIREQIGAAA